MSFIANINWSSPSWDLFIILFFVIAALVYGLSLGRDRIIVIMVGTYMALAVVNNAPFINTASQLLPREIGIQDLFVFKISSFLGAFVLLFFLLSRSALLKTLAGTESVGSWWQVFLFSILHVGLFISIALSFLPSQSLSVFSAPIRDVFVSDPARFFWIVAPIVLMALIKPTPRQDYY